MFFFNQFGRGHSKEKQQLVYPENEGEKMFED